LVYHTKPPPGRCRGRDAHATSLPTAGVCVQKGVIDVNIRDGYVISMYEMHVRDPLTSYTDV
jgi:hypothetical protein